LEIVAISEAQNLLEREGAIEKGVEAHIRLKEMR
jgi:hypothetical protein